MSDGEGKNDKGSDELGAGPTRSFNGSVKRPGDQIGGFRLERELGRGAAGVVYLAHDTKLDRQVAIKSLPAELMENLKARSRFSREAKVLASLNHPNIATIHEQIEESEGVGYIVLEYVAGQTLAERIARGGLKLQEVLTIALQIAEAVAAAHEHDVIHRDLKPGNIKITPEGNVKVLDFGLAKALGGEALDEQTTITEPGRVIGTPAYMSPEQARGKPTDKQSDIWSFGCVLYEMLTGKVPFEGETVSDTLASILEHEPNWQALPKSTPANICVLLRRCLEKDPRRRLQHIGDVAIELEETLSLPDVAPPVTSSTTAISAPTSMRRLMVWAGICLLAGAIAATVITWSFKRQIPTSMPVYRFSIRLPQNQMLNETWYTHIAVSPDGKRLVYVGGVGATRQLFLRETDQLAGRALPGTKGAVFPFFKPDGDSIGFGAEGKLKTLFLDRGKPKILCDAPNLRGGTWCSDRTILFTPGLDKGIWKVPESGGIPEPVTEPNKQDGELGHCFPDVLPGGEAVLFTVAKHSLNDTSIAVLSRKTGKWETRLPGASYARYTPTGHLLYAQSGTIMAAPFDLKKLKVGELRRPVIEGLFQHLYGGAYAPFCFSTDGLLFYVRGGDWLARRNIVWVDRHTGKVIEPLPLKPGAYSFPRLSPKRQSIAFTKFDSGDVDIWVCDLPKGPPTQVTFDGINVLAIWTPDGNKLTFTRAGPDDVYWKPANRSSSEEPLLKEPDRSLWPMSWSPDGKVLLFGKSNPVTGSDIYFLSTEDGNTTQPLICESGNQDMGVFSPDGNWIAYESDREEGRREVYVSPFPKHVPEKISTDGGYCPLWSADGKELFYRSGNKMMAVTIETEPELNPIESKVLFEGQYYTSVDRNYDVSRDGQRFLMIKSSEEEVTQLVVVPNFFEELKRLVPTAKNQ